MNKKRNLVFGGIIVLAVLAAGAYVGGQLLNGQGLPANASSGGPTIMLAGNGPGGGHSQVRFQTIPAKELPQRPADARGIFDHRQNNSFFVGTGNVTMMAKKDQSGNVTSSASHTGPTVEVVVSPRTTVYRDVTLKQFNGQMPSGTNKVQQVVEPGSLDEIGQYSDITAWGKKTGDRIDADVLVYSPPPVMNAR